MNPRVPTASFVGDRTWPRGGEARAGEFGLATMAPRPSSKFGGAPVAQWIERTPAKSRFRVRAPAGARSVPARTRYNSERRLASADAPIQLMNVHLMWAAVIVRVDRMSLDADSFVTDTPEKPAAINWPLAVEARLEQLLDQAKAAGERTTRKEIVAALVATSKLSDAQLDRMLRRYRKAKVREILSVPADENVVPITKQRPGPRTNDRSRSR